MRKLASVQTIHNVEAIEGADKIEVVSVLGWKCVAKKGEFKIIPQYKDTKGFKDGLAFVKDDSFEGYIDKQGKYIWKQAISSSKSTNSQAPARSTANVKNDLADNIFKELGL